MKTAYVVGRPLAGGACVIHGAYATQAVAEALAEAMRTGAVPEGYAGPAEVVKSARADVFPLADYATLMDAHGNTLVIDPDDCYPWAYRMTGKWRLATRVTTTGYTLILANAGDLMPAAALELAEAGVSWRRMPEAAREWADARGYGAAEELLYVLPGEVELTGWPTFYVAVTLS